MAKDLPMLVESGWLAKHLNESDLRILDCMVGSAAGREDVTTYHPDLIATKDEVKAAIGSPRYGLVCAFPPEDFSGPTVRWGRPGVIPTSAVVPTVNMIDPHSHAYLPLEQLRAMFASTGVLKRERIITYCGGAAAACSDAFILTLLGAANVAVYDGSLYEWATDPTMPLQTTTEQS